MSTINRIRLYRFFDDFVVVYPLYAIIFANAGLQISEISVLLFVWSFTAFVLEIPFGALADKYDRKTLLGLSQLVRICGYAVWLFFPTFWGFLLGFVLWGIKSSLTSGTFEAYLFDYLRKNNSEKQFPKLFGETKSLSLLAIMLSGLVASLVAGEGYQPVLILSIVALAVSAFGALSLPSVSISKSTGEVRYLQILLEGVRVVWRNSSIKYAVLSLAVITGGMAIDEYLPLSLVGFGLGENSLGLFLGVFTLAQAVSSFYAHKVRFSQRLWVVLLVIFASLIFVLGLELGPIGLFVWLGIGVLSAYLTVVGESSLQTVSTESTRATVASVKGFLAELIALSVFLITAVSDSLRSGFMIVGIAVAISLSLLVLWKKAVRA